MNKNNKEEKSLTKKRNILLAIISLCSMLLVFIIVLVFVLVNKDRSEKENTKKKDIYNILSEIITPSLSLFDIDNPLINYFVTLEYENSSLDITFTLNDCLDCYLISYQYQNGFIPADLESSLNDVYFNKDRYIKLLNIGHSIVKLDQTHVRKSEFYNYYNTNNEHSLYIESNKIYYMYINNNDYYCSTINISEEFKELEPIKNDTYLYHLYDFQFLR